MTLSIIIPCYNSDRFIKDTLAMLISQGLDDTEVIVVDDGSTDSTGEIVQTISQKEPRIRLIQKVNEGVSIARNTGLKEARGDFVYFMDSDDSLTEGTLDFYRTTIMHNRDKEFFGFGYYSYYKGSIKDYSAPLYDDMTLSAIETKKAFLGKKLNLHICSTIYAGKFLRDNGICFTPNLAVGEDVEFLLKVLEKSDSLVYRSRKSFIYQIRDDSTMQGYTKFTPKVYHAWEVRRDMMDRECFRDEDIVCYTNFWLQVNFISCLRTYIKSDFRDKDITAKFVQELALLKRKITCDADRKLITVLRISHLLPLKLVLKTL